MLVYQNLIMKKILVIEDNNDVRENLVELLELSNYEIQEAENGKVGLEKALSFNPDLILCDVMMPILDGYEVMKILSKNPKLNHIPLIFLTAKTEKADFRKGMGLGAEDYLTKPFNSVELLDAIENRLKKAEKLKKIFKQEDRELQHFFSEAKAQAEFEKLSSDKEIRAYEKNAPVYEEGQNPRYLFYLVSGKVKITQQNEFGKELTTKVLKAGDFFGFFSLIGNQAYSSDAKTIEKATIRLIPKEDFTILLYNNRDFSIQFMKMLSNSAIDTERKLIDMAYGSVRRKVANALIELSSLQSEDDNSSDKITITAKREALASLAATAKETLIRTLSDFKEERLISIKGKDITIQSIKKLRDLIV